MTDTWAAKVLDGVPRYAAFSGESELGPHPNGDWVRYSYALAAIAKLGAGDGLVERLQQRDKSKHGYYGYVLYNRDGLEAAAHIAALTAQNREMALDVLASSGQAQEAYAAQLAAEAERDYTHGTNEVLRAENQRIEADRDALRAKLARLEGALVDHNDLLRSALSIAKREGVDGEVASTNWDAYYNRVAVVLKRHHQIANDTRAALSDGAADA